MKKVNILLSTFNGEKYIREQMESLLKQTYENVTIYIYDDGSRDSTVEIIKEFCDFIHSKKIIFFDHSLHLGYPGCFIYMLQKCEKADYYAFCDQDDVWFDDKIERAVKELNKYESCPLLYYTAVKYCDKNLKFIRKSRFADKKQSCNNLKLQNLILGGEAMGMTYCFNEYVRESLIRSLKYTNQFKDIYIKILCASCGKVIYDSKPSAYYRRHDNAVTNNINPPGRLGRYIKAISDIFINDGTNSHIRNVINYILERENVSADNIKLLTLFSDINIRNQIEKVIYPHRFRKHFVDEIGYRIAIILRKI